MSQETREQIREQIMDAYLEECQAARDKYFSTCDVAFRQWQSTCKNARDARDSAIDQARKVK